MRRLWSQSRGPEDRLQVTAGSTLKRDVYKAVTAGFTGLTAFGALAVTGAVAGTAAHDKATEDAAAAAKQAEAQGQTTVTPAAPVAPVGKRRKHRTVVRTKVVHAVSTSGVSSPSSGGTVRAPQPTTSHSSTVTHSAPVPRPVAKPAPAPAPAPAPKPKPKPAPSSGS